MSNVNSVVITPNPNHSIERGGDGERGSEGIPRQIFPANAISDLVNRELMLEADFVAELAETQEDLSLMLGGRIRDLLRGDGKSDTARARAMLFRLVAEVSAVEAVTLEDLLGRFGDLAHHADPFEAMRQAGLDSGQMALLLGTWLTQKDLNGGRRKLLEDALSAVMGDEEWELKLFARLELTRVTPEALAQLKVLYQRASARNTSLSQWFAELKGMPDRRRKLQALLRALAFELSAQGAPIAGNRLAAVIMDLRRILLFLGFEEHCKHTTEIFSGWGISPEQYMNELLLTIDQIWFTPDWFYGRIHALGLLEAMHYSYGRAFSETIRLLSEKCFKEDMQRSDILQALEDYLVNLAEAE